MSATTKELEDHLRAARHLHAVIEFEHETAIERFEATRKLSIEVQRQLRLSLAVRVLS
jgi:hypothetical protein